MKKVLLLLLILMSLSACKGQDTAAPPAPTPPAPVPTIVPPPTLPPTPPPIPIEDQVKTIVISRIDGQPNDDTVVNMGNTLEFSAKAYDTDGNLLSGVPFKWYSSESLIATININTAVLTGVAPGLVDISVVVGELEVQLVGLRVRDGRFDPLFIRQHDGSSSDETVEAMARDIYGNVYVVGKGATVDVNGTLTGPSFLGKSGPEGTMQWITRFGTVNSIIQDIKISPDSTSIYVAGYETGGRAWVKRLSLSGTAISEAFIGNAEDADYIPSIEKLKLGFELDQTNMTRVKNVVVMGEKMMKKTSPNENTYKIYINKLTLALSPVARGEVAVSDFFDLEVASDSSGIYLTSSAAAAGNSAEVLKVDISSLQIYWRKNIPLRGDSNPTQLKIPQISLSSASELVLSTSEKFNNDSTIRVIIQKISSSNGDIGSEFAKQTSVSSNAYQKDVQTDSSGNIYVLSHEDGFPGNMYLTKFNTDLSFYGTAKVSNASVPGDIKAKALVLDTDGSSYILGETNGDAVGLGHAVSNYDVLLAKFTF